MQTNWASSLCLLLDHLFQNCLQKRTENKNENVFQIIFWRQNKTSYSLFQKNPKLFIYFPWLKLWEHYDSCCSTRHISLGLLCEERNDENRTLKRNDKLWHDGRTDWQWEERVSFWWVQRFGGGRCRRGPGTPRGHSLRSPCSAPLSVWSAEGCWMSSRNKRNLRKERPEGRGRRGEAERKKEKEKRQSVWWIRWQLGVISSCTPSSVNRKLQHRPPPSVDATGVTLIHTQDIQL